MGYTANRLIKIDGVDYDIGDVVPTAAVLPAYFKNLVRRGHISDTEVAAGLSQEDLDAAIDALIDGAPETLNTLNEIAAAVADNPTFYTYVDQDVTNGASPIFKKPFSTAATGPVTLDNTDHVFVASAGTFTVNLPAASGNTGREYIVQNSGAGVITVDGNASETVNGSTTQTLNQWESVTIVCDGTNWVIV